MFSGKELFSWKCFLMNTKQKIFDYPSSFLKREGNQLIVMKIFVNLNIIIILNIINKHVISVFILFIYFINDMGWARKHVKIVHGLIG